MFQEPNERLAEAVAAMRDSGLREEGATEAEQAIMSKARLPRAIPYRGVMLFAAISAVAVGSVLVLAPSKSFAAELRRIAKNGDTGMRHVRTWTVQSDGSKDLDSEYYVNGLMARWITHGSQLWWGNGIFKSLHQDGSVEICRRTSDAMLWMNDSAKQILSINRADPKAKVSVDHGFDWNGRVVDKYTVDGDFVDGRKQTLHSHMVLFANPKTEQPLEMDDVTTGLPRTIIEWDYADFDAKLLDLPPVDSARIYNSDEEKDQIKAALVSHGRKVMVGGQSVELLQLWIDETGHAAALAEATFSRPDNFGIRINGEGQDPEPRGKPFSGRYWIHKPTPYKGRPIQVFFNNRDTMAPRVTSPDEVTVEIPVFDDKSLLGYARFDNVPVHHTWLVHFLVEPMNLPFWGVTPQQGTGASTTAAN